MDPIWLKISNVFLDIDEDITISRSGLEDLRAKAFAIAEAHEPLPSQSDNPATAMVYNTAQTDDDRMSSVSSRSLAVFWKSTILPLVDALLQQVPVLRPKGKKQRADLSQMCQDFTRLARLREHINHNDNARSNHRVTVEKVNRYIHGGNCVLDALLFENGAGLSQTAVLQFEDIYGLTIADVLNNQKNKNMVELANKLGTLWLDEKINITTDHEVVRKMKKLIEKHRDDFRISLSDSAWQGIKPRYDELLGQAAEARHRERKRGMTKENSDVSASIATRSSG